MATRWALVFSACAWLTLVGTAALRRWARDAERRGAARASSSRRSLGGLVVAVASLVGLLGAPSPSRGIAAGVGVGAALALFAILRPSADLPRWTQFVAELIAAGLATAAGVTVHLTGAGLTDALVSVAWLVAVTSGVRRLDHTDGLAAAVGAASLLGCFVLAGFAGQYALATVALGAAAACIGFLAFNSRPASVFLGDSGSMFVGFVLGVLTIELRPGIAAPGSLTIPLLLAALPLLDLAVVVTGRFLHARPLGVARRDHLSHRLMALGISRSRALGLLVLLQLAMSALAVFVGRGVVPTVWTAAAGVALLVLVIVVSEAKVYRHRTRFPRRGARLAVLIGIGGAIAVLLVALVLTLDARRRVDNARASVTAGITAARLGDTRLAAARFNDAAAEFRAARGELHGPWTWPVRVVPVVSPNLRAVDQLSGVGADLAEAGRDLAARTDPNRLAVTGGTVPLDEVRRVEPTLEQGVKQLQRALHSLRSIDRDGLVGPVRDVVRRVDSQLRNAEDEARNGVTAARLAPAILGAHGQRRYFLAVQNPAELRGTGGLIGNWGILTADNGKVHLEQFGRATDLNAVARQNGAQLHAPPDFTNRYARFSPETIWENLNMSPDFPTIGNLINDLYPQSGGEHVDGVIAVDPVGLAALLQLTGPVPVEGWPVPITAQNVTDITLRQAYDRYGGTDRVEFIGDVARNVMDVATTKRLGGPGRIANVLGAAARRGHIILWFTQPDEQKLAERLGVAGNIPQVHSDSAFATTQNAAANKVDYYLHRRLDYAVQLAPDPTRREARVTGKLDLTLDNRAPAGVSSFALGPFDPRFAPGEDRSFISIYTPLHFSSATFDGAPTQLESGRELGRNVFSLFGSVPAGTRGTLGVGLVGTVALEPGGWYRLDLPHQPTLFPDDVTVTIRVPSGWEVVASKGLRKAGEGASGQFQLTGERTVAVRVRRALGRSLWQRLLEGEPR